MMRSISIDELAGFREALLEFSIQVDLSKFTILSIYGNLTEKIFNISTLVSFVLLVQE
jgi:anthranilate phosphoribosyltransferase